MKEYFFSNLCDKYFYSVDINKEKINKQGGTHQVFTLN